MDRTHFGKVLHEEFLRPRKLTQRSCAELLGRNWTQSKLSRVARGLKKVTADVAEDLARVFGNSALFWIDLRFRSNFLELSGINEELLSPWLVERLQTEGMKISEVSKELLIQWLKEQKG